MAKKLGIGDTFPNLTISLADGRAIDLPSGMASKYGVILFTAVIGDRIAAGSWSVLES